MPFVPLIAVLVILAAVYSVIRGVEVRLTLLIAAGLIGASADKLDRVLVKFLDTFSDEKYVLPICSAMGFAYVIRHAGCDAHLVRLLVIPVRKMKSLAIPGVACVAFIVNIPVVSQTSTAVCVGPVAIPLLRAAGYSPLACGATLCLGASLGGELLNPGAPELRTITDNTKTPSTVLSREHIPRMLLPYAAIAVLAHWWLMRKHRGEIPQEAVENNEPINYWQAMVPITPLLFLFLTGPPWTLLEVPHHWLSEAKDKREPRLIAVAMLIGVLHAMLVVPAKARDSMTKYFEGAGYGFTAVISLIVTANCFGEAIKLAGLATAIGEFIHDTPSLLVPLSVFGPWFFAFISGSGIASTQSLYAFFHDPAAKLGADPDSVGAGVSVGAAAGRTMSPVSAVVLMCSTLTKVKPFEIVKQLAVPLAAGLTAVVVLRMLQFI